MFVCVPCFDRSDRPFSVVSVINHSKMPLSGSTVDGRFMRQNGSSLYTHLSLRRSRCLSLHHTHPPAPPHSPISPLVLFILRDG